MIKVKLYGTEVAFENAKKAKDYFMGGVYSSEGAERDRYLNIIMAIESGETDINSDSPSF